MSIELQKFFSFCAAHLPVRLDIDEIPVFIIFDMVVQNKKLDQWSYINSSIYSSPTHTSTCLPTDWWAKHL